MDLSLFLNVLSRKNIIFFFANGLLTRKFSFWLDIQSIWKVTYRFEKYIVDFFDNSLILELSNRHPKLSFDFKRNKREILKWQYFCQFDQFSCHFLHALNIIRNWCKSVFKCSVAKFKVNIIMKYEWMNPQIMSLNLPSDKLSLNPTEFTKIEIDRADDIFWQDFLSICQFLLSFFNDFYALSFRDNFSCRFDKNDVGSKSRYQIVNLTGYLVILQSRFFSVRN